MPNCVLSRIYSLFVQRGNFLFVYSMSVDSGGVSGDAALRLVNADQPLQQAVSRRLDAVGGIEQTRPHHVLQQTEGVLQQTEGS